VRFVEEELLVKAVFKEKSRVQNRTTAYPLMKPTVLRQRVSGAKIYNWFWLSSYRNQNARRLIIPLGIQYFQETGVYET